MIASRFSLLSCWFLLSSAKVIVSIRQPKEFRDHHIPALVEEHYIRLAWSQTQISIFGQGLITSLTDMLKWKSFGPKVFCSTDEVARLPAYLEPLPVAVCQSLDSST